MNRQSAPPNFTLYPLLWLSVCFAAGIAAAGYSDLDWRLFLAGSLLFGCLTALFLNRRSVILLALAFAFLGGLCFQSQEQNADPYSLKGLYETGHIKTGDPVEIEGVLTGKPELTLNGHFLALRAVKIRYKGAEHAVTGNVRFFAPSRDESTSNEYAALDLRYGSRVRIAANLQRDERFLNPGVVSRIDLLGQQETDASGVIESPLLIEKVRDEEVFAPLAWVYEQRQNLIDEFREKFSVSTAGIMIASLLGNKKLSRPAHRRSISRWRRLSRSRDIGPAYYVYRRDRRLSAPAVYKAAHLAVYSRKHFHMGLYTFGRRAGAGRACRDYVYHHSPLAAYYARGYIAEFAGRVRDYPARLAARRSFHRFISADIYERRRDRRLRLSVDRKTASDR
jgi:hypothetical protein